MEKIALFVFNGDSLCFIHVLLNALDMYAKGYDAKIVMEGASTKLLLEVVEKSHPLKTLWETAKANGCIAGVCRACSQKMKTINVAKSEGLALLDDMNGHPSMTRFREAGYDIITF